jgi:hypothetical protein
LIANWALARLARYPDMKKPLTLAQITGARSLYDMHLRRLSAIKSGASQHAYDEAQIAEFERETARLKALLDSAGPRSPG